ncbi:MAG: NADH-quinone oxidoreductase subunit NuoB [Candidatus Melainabacteria bacterium]|nr:NADH-quinone oxidoreductase subunit NuoB [Candidatus Melainabacteria bacterium]
MFKLLSYLISQGTATAQGFCPPLDDDCLGLPTLTSTSCMGTDCSACANICPTKAIQVLCQAEGSSVTLDRGACIGCSLCIETCPTGTIVKDLSTQTATTKRQDLVLSTTKLRDERPILSNQDRQYIFHKSLAVRVVSTGCSACDLEIGASGNPIFDMERFGVQIVASPRAADALLVTGPVGKGMQEALKRCWEAMSEPRLVIAVGTCSISGGVHKEGYADTNGLEPTLPVDVYIPGCPPHPWSIIYGIALAMKNTKL